MRKIEISLEDAQRVYRLMEDMNDFFHQPAKYNETEKFAKKNYGEIKTLYYDVIWNWLPQDIKDDITGE